MPWKINDVDKFKKGLTDAQKTKWVKIANAILAQCIKDGGFDLDCEIKAIRTANARIDNKDESDLARIANQPTWFDRKNSIRPMTCELNQDDEYQMVFPIGLFNTGKYGEVIITRTFADRAVENWKKLSAVGRKVFMDTQHDFGEANAWAKDIIADEDGLKAKWEFNKKGKELIDDNRFKYYSAAFMPDIDIETGKEMYPVLEAVSLTNSPVMYTMPAAHLDRGTIAHSDDKNINPMEGKMTLKELLEKLKEIDLSKITDDEKADLAKTFGIELPTADNDTDESKVELDKAKTENEALKDVNKKLSDRLSSIEKQIQTQKKNDVIESAIKACKIAPAEREVWEKRFDKSPEFTEEILNDMKKTYDLDPVGTPGNRNEGSKLSGNDKIYAEAFGLGEADYQEFENPGTVEKKPANKKKEE